MSYMWNFCYPKDIVIDEFVEILVVVTILVWVLDWLDDVVVFFVVRTKLSLHLEHSSYLSSTLYLGVILQHVLPPYALLFLYNSSLFLPLNFYLFLVFPILSHMTDLFESSQSYLRSIFVQFLPYHVLLILFLRHLILLHTVLAYVLFNLIVRSFLLTLRLKIIRFLW